MTPQYKQITQHEINNLPPPPQEWLDDIALQKSLKILEEYEYMNIYDNIKSLMKLDVKKLKKEIKNNKNDACYYDGMNLKQSRNGKITKKGLIKNLLINYYEMDTRDCGHVNSFFKKGIEYLVDIAKK